MRYMVVPVGGEFAVVEETTHHVEGYRLDRPAAERFAEELTTKAAAETERTMRRLRKGDKVRMAAGNRHAPVGVVTGFDRDFVLVSWPDGARGRHSEDTLVVLS